LNLISLETAIEQVKPKNRKEIIGTGAKQRLMEKAKWPDFTRRVDRHYYSAQRFVTTDALLCLLQTIE
jgi:hypothetical protein